MNTKTLIAAVSLALAGTAAFAAEVTEFPDPTSIAQRADVVVQIPAARAQAAAPGQVLAGGEAYGAVQAPKQASGLTRAQVVAELRLAQANGETDRLGEMYGYINSADKLASGLSRAEVQAAAKAHTGS
jgi:hypothetical protein